MPGQFESHRHKVVVFAPNSASLIEIDPKDGAEALIATTSLANRNEKPEIDQLLSLGPGGPSAYLWIEGDRLFSLNLHRDNLGQRSELSKGASGLPRLGLENRGISILSRKDGTFVVYRLTEGGSIEQVWQFTRAVRPSLSCGHASALTSELT